VSAAGSTTSARTRQASGPQPSRPPAYQELADEIRSQIVSGRLRPGERLPTEPQLCARSGLSRSTVREALRLLSSQHLIVTTRGVTGGSFVAEPSAERLGDSLVTALRVLGSGRTLGSDQFLEMREMLEVPGAALAAARRTDADLAALREHLVHPEGSGADQAVLDARLVAYGRFHAALATAVHNPLYTVLARPLYEPCHLRELCRGGPPDLWPRVSAGQRAVLDRVVELDSTGAAEAVRAHLADLRAMTPAMTP
jgi:DNA-binding FadR family transcriptional regulator